MGVHPDRNITGQGGIWRPVRQAWDYRDSRLPWVIDEPIGHKSTVAEDFDPRVAVARIRSTGPDLKLGDALLGQRLVAGIGNIFRSEGCFAAGIDPRTPVGGVSDDELVTVLDATRTLMLEAVDTGRQPDPVYRRAGMACPVCGTKILRRPRARPPDDLLVPQLPAGAHPPSPGGA
jgi:endonuclease-8